MAEKAKTKIGEARALRTKETESDLDQLLKQDSSRRTSLEMPSLERGRVRQKLRRKSKIDLHGDVEFAKDKSGLIELSAVKHALEANQRARSLQRSARLLVHKDQRRELRKAQMDPSRQRRSITLRAEDSSESDDEIEGPALSADDVRQPSPVPSVRRSATLEGKMKMIATNSGLARQSQDSPIDSFSRAVSEADEKLTETTPSNVASARLTALKAHLRKGFVIQQKRESRVSFASIGPQIEVVLNQPEEVKSDHRPSRFVRAYTGIPAASRKSLEMQEDSPRRKSDLDTSEGARKIKRTSLKERIQRGSIKSARSFSGTIKETFKDLGWKKNEQQVSRSDAKTTTWPFRLISFSSERRGDNFAARNLTKDELGFFWETDGNNQDEHWLILDLGASLEIAEVQIQNAGSQFDAKAITILRGGPGVEDIVIGEEAKRARWFGRNNPEFSSEATSELLRCPWIVVRRCMLKSGPDVKENRQKITFKPHMSRFLRLVFHQSWSSTGNIRLQPPLLIVAKFVPLTVKDIDGSSAVLERSPSLTTVFSEFSNLTEEEREIRQIARKHKIPIPFADYVRALFNRFDTNKTGELDYEEFGNVVRTMSVQSTMVAYGGKVAADVSEKRLRHIWNAVDADHSGVVEYEEFLIWLFTNFKPSEDDQIESFHSDLPANSPLEHYYAALGRNRLKAALEHAKKKDAEDFITKSGTARPQMIDDKDVASVLWKSLKNIVGE